MAEFATIPLAQIIVPPRLREVNEDQALILSSQIAWQGLLNPITVRRTPPATKPFLPFTLIAGAHRRRGVELLQRPEIDAMIVKADAVDGMMLEVSENLIRNELTQLERAIFVLAYREAWEKRYGAIKRGGSRKDDQSGNLPLCSSDGPTNIVEAAEERNFFAVASKRLGIDRTGVMRAQRIAKNLNPTVRRQLRSTEYADNQSLLLKLAGMGPERQRAIAEALERDRDLKRAIENTDPNARAKARKSGQDEILDRLLSTWSRANDATREKFLALVKPAKPPRETLPSVSAMLGALHEPTAEEEEAVH